MKKVDIIVPVYAGLIETKRCLEAVLHYPQVTDFELIVINDQSPEPLLIEYLEELARTNQIILLSNPQNLGFVCSVNRGMQLHEDRDVVLLNSDTEPVNDWLDRLVACSYRDEKTGTVTPFSNNATICSYPIFCQDNKIPFGMDSQNLDNIFKMANTGKSIEIPTAVGFCMYIRRDCLQEVGFFDVDSFGKGYGEENDFSMRASHRGWKNVLCGDVFVYHKGNVSFGDEHNKRKLAATEKMRSLHPDYDTLVYQHVIEDPANILRHRVMLTSLLRHSSPLVLYISHKRGGGTERRMQEQIVQLSETTDAILLRPNLDDANVAEIDYQGYLKLYFNMDQEFEKLINFLKTLNLQRIHIHHTLGIHPAIFNLPERLNIPWDYSMHDYYAFCPQTYLIDRQGRYCGEPKEEGCNACLKHRPAPDNVSIKTWRENHAKLITGAERCFAPSKYAADRLKVHFPIANVMPVYNEKTLPVKHLPVKLQRQSVDRLRVIVIGALSPMNGADFLERIALDAMRRNLAIDFILLGYCYRDMIISPQNNLTITGAYQETELLELIAHHKPDIAWFPALWPETYCDNLSAAIQAGLPIVAPNIGAFQEILHQRSYTWIIPWDVTENALNNFFIELKKSVFSGIDLKNHRKAYLLLFQPIMVKMMAEIRYAILLWLEKLRKLRVFRWLVRLIPKSVLGCLKNWLLRNHDGENLTTLD